MAFEAKATEFPSGYARPDLTCWETVTLGTSSNSVKIAAISIISLISILSIACNTWCAIVIFTTRKLRKPTWIFKASMALKDIIFCFSMATYGLWTATRSTSHDNYSTDDKAEFFNPVEFIFNVIFTTCISASFVHILLISFDRHQVMSRPFRYHTGELLPAKVACILIGSGWTFCFVIGLSVTSQSLEYAERVGNLAFSGAIYPLYRVPALQKWLLGSGMGLLYVITGSLLCVALAIELNRAKTRKARLLSGTGAPEPLRSRNNSVCHAGTKRTRSSGLAEDSCNNSEADANEFLLSGGGFDFAGLAMGDRRQTEVEQVTIFTPVHYRPSLQRRIRDTWSLYSAIFCLIVFTVTTAIPFLVIVLADAPLSIFLGTADDPVSQLHGPPTSYCVGILVMENFLLLQGMVYVTIYVFIDDVFRPYFVRPFKLLRCKKQDERLNHSRKASSTRSGNPQLYNRGHLSSIQAAGNNAL